jgi:hypothetical protein
MANLDTSEIVLEDSKAISNMELDEFPHRVGVLAAVHEAGHAVSAVLLDVPFSVVELVEDDPRIAGRTEFSDDYGPDVTDSQIKVRLAGGLAEWRYLGYPRGIEDVQLDRDSAEYGRACTAIGLAFSDDWSTIERGVIKEELRTSDEIGALMAETASLVSEEWSTIERVAELLLECKKLTYDEVAAAVRVAPESKPPTGGEMS